MNYSKGFTLIELLVVIAIIGILSAIVISSLNVARAKGSDAKTESQLKSIQDAAQVYQNDHGDFGPVSTDCSDPSSIFTDTASGMAVLTNPNNYPQGASPACDSQTSTYAVSAFLTSSTTISWCVDSTGASIQTTANPAIDPTTHLCAGS